MRVGTNLSSNRGFTPPNRDTFLSSRDLAINEPPSQPTSSLPAWARAPDGSSQDADTLDWGSMPIPSSGMGGANGAGASTASGTPPTGFGEGWQDVFRGGRIFEPLMQRAPPEQSKRPAPVVDRPLDLTLPQTLNLPSQDASDIAAARAAALPPLQSVVELTTAWKPPVRTGEETEAQILEQRQAAGALCVWEMYCKYWSMLIVNEVGILLRVGVLTPLVTVPVAANRTVIIYLHI